MCDVCDEAAEIVGNASGMSAEAVRKIVRAFREESETILERQARETAEPVGPEQEHDETAPDVSEFVEQMIGGGAVAVVEMYPLGVRPFVLIEAEQIGEEQADGLATVAVMASSGGGLSQEAARELVEKTLAQMTAGE